MFDLDPSDEDPTCGARGGNCVRDLLDELGLPSWVKTSGSKGFHIVVPLDGKAKMDEVARFANTSARLVSCAGSPDAGIRQGRSRDAF